MWSGVKKASPQRKAWGKVSLARMASTYGVARYGALEPQEGAKEQPKWNVGAQVG